MRFYAGPVPPMHQTNNFTFRPLSPKYTALDFEALMATKTVLRQWSNSPWPNDDFTLEANRADLQRHDDEFRNNVAYAYTVLNPQESRVEGCVYLNPLRQFLGWVDAPEAITTQVAAGEAHMGFWIRGDRLGDEDLLLGDILDWLDTHWQFSHVTFATYDTSNRQVDLYRARGMRLRFRLTRPGGVNVLFYHMS
jgi:hypothetical protein